MVEAVLGVVVVGFLLWVRRARRLAELPRASNRREAWRAVWIAMPGIAVFSPLAALVVLMPQLEHTLKQPCNPALRTPPPVHPLEAFVLGPIPLPLVVLVGTGLACYVAALAYRLSRPRWSEAPRAGPWV